MNACEDFFETVVIAHVISCAMNLLGLSDVGDVPTRFITSDEVWMLDDTERRQILMDTVTQIIEDNVDLSVQFFLMVSTALQPLQQTVCIAMHVKFSA